MNRLKVWGVLAVILVFAVAGVAQTYEGRILGTVTDQSGGVVKDAKVTITNVDTGVSRSLVTNEAGDYVAPNLPPGVYKITVEVTGFKKIERLGVRLEVAKDARIDFVLEPGAITESIRVTEEAPLVETTNDTLGGSFANKAINDLPLNGREYQNLVVLRPGVQRVPGGGFLSISSNGVRPEDNAFLFDGMDNNDPYYGVQVVNTEGVQGTPGSLLPIDAIQEFNAVENPPAEYGMKPGAVINVGIKSGTNDIHGTASYFVRNNALDARNFFNPVIDPTTGLPSPQRGLHQHQFGGSLGGPIIKNKTFFFGAYEGVRALVSNSNGALSPATVSLGGATSNCTFVLTGDCANSIVDALRDLAAQPGFTIASGTCGSAPVTKTSGGQPSLNPLSANLIGCGAFTGNGAYPGLFPMNSGGNGANILSGFPNTNRMDAFVIKGDHHFNDRHSISGSYFLGDSLQQEQDIIVLRPEWRSQSQLRAQVGGVTYTWVPTTRWVNEARFSYTRFWQSILTVDHDKDPVKTYGINAGNVTNAVNFGMPGILIKGLTAGSTTLGGNPGWPLLTIPNETYRFADNVSYTIGRHTIRFGGEFRDGKTHNLRNRRGKGRIRFNGSQAFPTGMGSTPLEDFLAGFPTKGDIFVGSSERFVSQLTFGSFIQDDWRVTPRLTVNAGVRYDLTSAIRERQNLLGNFDPNVGLQQVGVNLGSPYNADYKNIGPRLGIAWDPWGKGKTVIRAGGSIIYEYPHLNIFLGQNGVNNATTTGLNSIPTGAVGSNLFGKGGNILGAATTQPGATLNWSVAGPIFNVAPDCNANPCDILGVTRNLRTPYVIGWNFNIQQALGSSTSFQLGYVGNHGVKLYSVRDINQVDPNSPAEIACSHCEQAGRPFATKFPFLEFINFLENQYGSHYHSLQASITQRVWHGLTLVGGYTYAHAIDYASLNRAFQPQNSLRPDLEKGDSSNDVRHRFTLALTYDLPSRKGFGQLLEGWQINSIVVIQTGEPYPAVDFGDDTSLTGEFSDRWNVIAPPSSIPNFAVNAPIPVSNVLAPPACPGPCFGNGGRNTLIGPHYRNWDFSIAKTFRLSERLNVQFRGEFFNVLNHPNFASPGNDFNGLGNNDLSSPGSFGNVFATPDVAGANPVIGSGGPRNIQVGIKFRF